MVKANDTGGLSATAVKYKLTFIHIHWWLLCNTFVQLYFLFLRFQMGLIPSVESGQDFCSQSDLNPFRCIGLAIRPGSQDSLPEVCEALIKSLSARIHNGATRKELNSMRHTVQYQSEVWVFQSASDWDSFI